MQVQPYLFFNGRCEEALAFYHEALGAEITMQMRYSENPDGCPEGMECVEQGFYSLRTSGGFRCRSTPRMQRRRKSSSTR